MKMKPFWIYTIVLIIALAVFYIIKRLPVEDMLAEANRTCAVEGGTVVYLQQFKIYKCQK